ncbi:uncharacterized protein LOC126685735 [Mercurialis annua]|uniref:uncharacterized protein LOC126685735 n=1 Tax=Mercurialis annua TaxID=3986 RepID=UPI00215FE5FB|nr:uncharacterized protein LOC126685735 [Mercurialis annua]
MNNAAPSEPPPPPVELPELILSLEQATFMAKQLPITTDPNQHLEIYSFLHQAHWKLSSFISRPPQPLYASAAAPENSVSSATGADMAGGYDGDEPMQVVDDDNEENSKTSVDKVEEKMRGCFIKNKRAKRPLSPSSAAEDRRRLVDDDGDGRGLIDFDPHWTKLKALDLIYQFHG